MSSSIELHAAFPSRLAVELDEATPELRLPCGLMSRNEFVIDAEPLKMPYRVYFKPQLTPHSLVGACIHTRHPDGFVRARHLNALLASAELWVVPFVIQLLSEYVIEIIERIAAEPALMQRPSYLQFAKDNLSFVDISRQRATSYWNAYWRGRFSRKEQYPALRLLRGL